MPDEVDWEDRDGEEDEQRHRQPDHQAQVLTDYTLT